MTQMPASVPRLTPRTRADVRGLPEHQQQALLLATVQLLRWGEAMEIRLDAQDGMHAWLEGRMPGRFAWNGSGDHATVRRTDAARHAPATAAVRPQAGSLPPSP